MSKRTNTNYRKIWENFNHTKIPKGYHIHHIDGNNKNNDPSNLLCVSPQEHFTMHMKQGDIVAIHGKFIQGASAAGKLGGKISKPNWEEGNKKKNLSEGLKKYYNIRGGSPLQGKKLSEEHRTKISTSMTGKNNPMYGKTHTTESKKKISKNKKGQKGTFCGKKHTQKTKTLMSNYAKTRTGIKNPMYGRSIVTEQNLKWYTNGIKTIFVTEGTEPTGYIRGRKI